MLNLNRIRIGGVTLPLALLAACSAMPVDGNLNPRKGIVDGFEPESQQLTPQVAASRDAAEPSTPVEEIAQQTAEQTAAQAGEQAGEQTRHPKAAEQSPLVADCPELTAIMAPSEEQDTGPEAESALPVVEQHRFEGERFEQIWGSGDADIWAIGRADPVTHSEEALAAYECDPTRFEAATVVRHFDGSRWERVDFPDEIRVADVHGTTADDVWAVGALGRAWHYDGESWTSFDSSARIAFDGQGDRCAEAALVSVWANSRTDVWAAGHVRVMGNVSPLLIHFDGECWTRQDVSGEEGLAGVWAADVEHVWAVGARGAVHVLEAGSWRRAPSITEHNLTSVYGDSSRNVWVAGSFATLLRFDGDDWKASEPAVDHTLIQGLTGREGAGLWMLSGSVVERAMNVAFVQTLDHWDGTQWCSVRRTEDTGRMLSDVWVSPSGRVWATGEALFRLL